MNKPNFIAELFESEMYNVLRFNNHSDEITEILNTILQTGKELEAILDDNGKELFSKYTDLHRQYVTENEYESFAHGFRLGAGCMLDTFV